MSGAAAIAAAGNPAQVPPRPAVAQAPISAPVVPRSQPTAPGAQSVSSGLPVLQPGWWEYQRTQVSSATGSEPKKTTTRKCIAPTAELDRNLSALRQRGCVLTPFEHHENRHEATWRCNAGNGEMVEMHEIITINSPTSYRVDTQAAVGNETKQSTTLVNRLGECPPVSKSPLSGRHTP
jgi:hypothetical protein